MARLDGLIDRLLKQDGGLELQLQTGNGVDLKTRENVLQVLRQPLTTQQILGALGELCPEDLRRDFPYPGPSRFPYPSPSGPVLIQMELANGQVRALIQPYGGSAAQPAARPEAVPAPPAAVESEPAPTPESPAEPEQTAAAPAEADAESDDRALEFELPPEDGGEIELASAAEMLELAAQPGEADNVLTALTSSADRKLAELLELMLAQRASDLHLSSQTVPMIRVDGDVRPVEGWAPVSHDLLKAMLWSIAPDRNKAEWEEVKDTDFAHEVEAARFRVNVFMDRKGIGAVLRQIPTKIMTAEEMGLSKHILDLCFLPKGLVLVTGPTGSGKTTTLATMIDHINRNRSDHIITIEDPIEFVHENRKCLVNQREVNVHTQSFKGALRAALREDPDIVLVGELRDLETIAIAIETAETGHLVFGTLHTSTAASTVDRVIDQFPADRQEQIRTMLSESLKGVISQTLVKKIGGGRAAAYEVLMCTSSVANLIREGKTFQIASMMQTGRNVGMVMMNDALVDLVKRKVVEPQDAYAKAVNKTELKAMLERAGFKVETEGV